MNPAEVIPFLAASFAPGRTMLGTTQLERLEQDLLDARDNGVTWKFMMVGEPIQNYGPIVDPGDRFEGYAAERTRTAQVHRRQPHRERGLRGRRLHWLSVNNLTYQDHFGGPQIASSAFEVVVPSLGGLPCPVR